jgi:hypothetical protein
LNPAFKPVPASLKKPGFLTFLAKKPSHKIILGVADFILGIAGIGLVNAFPGLGIAESILGLAGLISAIADFSPDMAGAV